MSNCEICNKENKEEHHKFCSRDCWNTYQRGRIRKSNRRQGSLGRGRGMNKKQRIELIIERGSKCEICGFNELPEILIAHHKIALIDNGSFGDTNIQIVCPNCHSKIHFYSHSKQRTLQEALDYYRERMRLAARRSRERKANLKGLTHERKGR